MYIKDHFASVTLPNIELKGFRKISLKKRETKTVSFVIDSDLLRFYDNSNNFTSEPGSFSVKIGNSSVTENAADFVLF